MAVETFGPQGRSSLYGIPSCHTRPCFYCGKRLTEPFVTWDGFNDLITLHAHCTVELMLRLSRDVHEIERIICTDITSRTLPALRDLLRREEGLS